MRWIRLRNLVAFLMVLRASLLHAQHGCFHSPEAPTDVLVVVGAAGMFYGSSLVRRWTQSRRDRRERAAESVPLSGER